MKKFLRKNNIEQNLILTLLLCSIYCFFHEKIENFLIDSTFVVKFLVIKTNTISTVVALILICISVSLLYCRYDFKFSSKIVFLPITFTLIYLYERLYGDYKIVFASINCLDSVKYFDIIVLFVDIFFIHNILKKQKEPVKFERKHGFFEDLALDKDSIKDEDILKYKNYAKRLAENIEKSRFKNAFAIGITGIWGAGKTSFMNLILNSFCEDKVVKINYNPWSANNVNQIIPNFFETITEELKNEGIFINNDLSKYLHKISQVELGVLGESFKPIINGFSDDFSIEDLKSKIDNRIIAKGKKIIITIDDLDRLNKHEINEVLKLIRNTANFSNICYLVAYDKEYVISFLKDDYQFDFRNYLEKIFQLEINLPAFKKRILIDKLKQNLEKIFDEISDEKLKEKNKKQIKSLADYDVCFDSIDNLRDITRLSNAMLINYIPLAGEVYIFDFINLEILRMKHREVYDLLKKDKLQLLEDSTGPFESSTKANRLVLKKDFQRISEEKKISNDAVKILNTIFYNELKIYNQVDINTSNLYRISTPSRFILYFTYAVNDDELSLNKLIESLYDELSFKRQIKYCVDENKQYLLNEYFENNDSFDSIEEYKNFIKGLFYFSSQESKVKFYTYRNLITVDVKIIFNKLRSKPSFFPDKQFIDFYFGLFEIKQFDNEAFIKLFFIIDILEIYSFDDTLLKKDKIVEVLNLLMFLYIKDCFSVSDELGVICDRIRSIEKKYSLEINTFRHLLYDKIKANLKNVLKESLVKYSSRVQEGFFTIHDSLRICMNDLINFKDFLEKEVDAKLKNESFYLEYLKFLSEIIDFENKSKNGEYKHVYIDLSSFE